MPSIAIFYFAFELATGVPAEDGRARQDSTHLVVAEMALLNGYQAAAKHANARTEAVLRLRNTWRTKAAASYPRNLDWREGYSEALEEQLRMWGPIVPHQEKYTKPGAPQNL